MLRQLLNDECGAIISAELVVVLTAGVLSTIVGLSEVAVSVNTELNDLSNAFGSLSQTYAYSGFTGAANSKVKSFVVAGSFTDAVDDCDHNTTGDIVSGASITTTLEGSTF
jgi:hypothetical protein